MSNTAAVTASKGASGKSGSGIRARADGLVSVFFQEGRVIDEGYARTQRSESILNLEPSPLHLKDIEDKWIYVFYKGEDGAVKFAAEIRAIDPEQWLVWYKPNAKTPAKQRHEQKPVITEGFVKLNASHLLDPSGCYAFLSRVPLSARGLEHLAKNFRLRKLSFSPEGEEGATDGPASNKDGTASPLFKLPSEIVPERLRFGIVDFYQLAEDVHAYLFMPALDRWHAFVGNKDRQAQYLIAKSVKGWIDLKGPRQEADPYDVKSKLRHGEPDAFIKSYDKDEQFRYSLANSKMSQLVEIVQSPEHRAMDISAMDVILKKEGDRRYGEVGIFHYGAITRGMMQVPAGIQCIDWILESEYSFPGQVIFSDSPSFDDNQVLPYFAFNRKVWLAGVDIFMECVSRRMQALEMASAGKLQNLRGQETRMDRLRLENMQKSDQAELDSKKAREEAWKLDKEAQDMRLPGDLKNSEADDLLRKAKQKEAQAAEIARQASQKADEAARAGKKLDDLKSKLGNLEDLASDDVSRRIKAYLKRLDIEVEITWVDSKISSNMEAGKSIAAGFGPKTQAKIRKRMATLKRKSKQQMPDEATLDRARQDVDNATSRNEALRRETAELRDQASAAEAQGREIRRQADRLANEANPIIADAKTRASEAVSADLKADRLAQKAAEHGEAAEMYLRNRARMVELVGQQERRVALRQFSEFFDKAPVMLLGIQIEAVINIVNLNMNIADLRRADQVDQSIVVNVVGASVDLLETGFVAGAKLIELDIQYRKALGASLGRAELHLKVVGTIGGVLGLVGGITDTWDAVLKANSAVIKTRDFKVSAAYWIAAGGAATATVGAGFGLAAALGVSAASGPAFWITLIGTLIYMGAIFAAEWIRDNDYEVFARHCHLGMEHKESVTPDWATSSFGNTDPLKELFALTEMLSQFRVSLYVRGEKYLVAPGSRPENDSYLVLEVTPGLIMPDDGYFDVDLDVRRKPSGRNTGAVLPSKKRLVFRQEPRNGQFSKHEWPVGYSGNLYIWERWEFDYAVQLRGENGKPVGQVVKRRGDLPEYDVLSKKYVWPESR